MGPQTDKQDGQQHQQRADHSEQNKLNGRIDAPLTAPNADQEVHRYQREFPEDVEQYQVQGQEDTNHTHFQQKEEEHKALYPLLNRGPGGKDGQWGQECGQQYHQDADAVHPQEEIDLDTACLQPGNPVAHLNAGFTALELGQHPQRQAKGQQGGQQRNPSDGGFLLLLDEDDDKKTDQWEKCHQD